MGSVVALPLLGLGTSTNCAARTTTTLPRATGKSRPKPELWQPDRTPQAGAIKWEAASCHFTETIDSRDGIQS